ncbi:MAG: hypothetical protein KY460_07000 [Actinobacteria bacterium]|nr:hypothetical protein [Actinomycetota bacterium]
MNDGEEVGVDHSGNDRGTALGRPVTRRDALTRATYGVAGLLLLRAPGTPGRLTPARAGGKAGAVPTAPTPAADAPAVAHTATRLPGNAQPRGLCDGRSGVMVVGMTGAGDPVSWHSRDGRRWQTHRLPSPADGDAEVWGVAAHGARYIAVGSVLQRRAARVLGGRAGDGAQGDVTFVATHRRPTVWWTDDRATWTPATVEDTTAAHAQLIAVSCDGSMLVAVGSTLDVDGVQGDGGLILRSHDGRTWRPGELTSSAGLPEGSFTGVAAAGRGWFATSSDMAGGAVWSSSDGLRWSLLAPSRRQFAGMTLQGLGVHGRDVHVVATRLADHAIRYYASSDGCRTWRRLRPRVHASRLRAAAVTVTDLAVIDDDVVVVGTRGAAPVIEGGINGGGH